MEQELKINFSIRIQLPEQSLATMFSRKEKKKKKSIWAIFFAPFPNSSNIYFQLTN